MYSETSQTSKMGRFTNWVNGINLLTIFAKRSILHVWQGSEYASRVYVACNIIERHFR